MMKTFVHAGGRVSELAGVLLVASSLLLLLSMVSYEALDPSLNVSSPSESYANYAGKVGAWVSDLLFQALGLSAFCMPLPFLFVGYRKIRSYPLDYPFLKLLGFLCALMAISAGSSLLSTRLPGMVHFAPGGILGILLSEQLLTYLNRAGSLLVVVTLLLSSLLLTTRFSLDTVLSWSGTRSGEFFSMLLDASRQWRKRRSDRRELKRMKKRKKALVIQSIPGKTVLERPLALEAMEERLEARRDKTPDESGPSIRPAGSPAAEWAPTTAPEQTLRPLYPPARPHQLPSLDFLQAAEEEAVIDEQELMDRAHKLAAKCTEFDVHGRVLQIHPGPVVTTFEFKPDPGIKYSRITSLADDLCLGLKAESIRIDRIPGKNTVGIEVPNRSRQPIYLGEILSSAAFQQSRSLLTLGLGKLINGNTYVTHLERMPHLLIAGATGSGKSVSLNAMVCSVLYKASPLEVRFIMIDPKRLELGIYDGIPHLLTPIVDDPKQAAHALQWAVSEMEERYRVLARHGVRNIDQYNLLLHESGVPIEADDERTPLPYIVIIVDELADLMMTAGKEVEASLTRLAQMARAIGIHLILATQRPSVDVLTGLIKANFPSRISFRVSSKVDSRTIIDGNGAELLLGQGDSLFLPPATSRLVRIHGAYISEKEIRRITEFLKKQAEPEYQSEVLEGPEVGEGGVLEGGDLDDELYEEAARFVVETGRASTSLLQRRLRIGYGRAARLLDMMEHEGIISPPDGSRPREVLVAADHFDELEK